MAVKNAFAGPVVLLFAVFAFVHGQVPNDLNVSANPPSLNAKITIGFNYDLLRPPTDVSFDYAKGYVGINIPFEQSGLVPKATADNIWSQMSKQLSQNPAKRGNIPAAGLRPAISRTRRSGLMSRCSAVLRLFRIFKMYISII